MSKIERLADVLTAELHFQDTGNRLPAKLHDGRIDYLDQSSVDIFACVRAILTAMREPRRGTRKLDWADDPLFAAPSKAGVEVSEGTMSTWAAYQAWQAMIDHILAP